MKDKAATTPKPLSASGNKPQVSKQVYQVAKAISGSAPNTAGGQGIETRSSGFVAPTATNDNNSHSQVQFAVNTKLTNNNVISNTPSSPLVATTTTAFNNAFGGTADSSASHQYASSFEQDRLRERQLEAEIMGESTRAVGGNTTGNKSQAIEKNLNQMIKVLNSRLQALDTAAKTRLQLLAEDLNPGTNKMSDQAPKIVDEFDDAIIPRSLRDMKSSIGPAGTTTGGGSGGANSATATTAAAGGGPPGTAPPAVPSSAALGIGHSNKGENLVSSDVVFIDPYHLVVRTKSQTEASKKLELALEESFGNSTLREMKNKKNLKNLNQSEKSKRTEQLKNEAKRMNRLRIEKKLQLNMETFVTRSVMDNELLLLIPENSLQEIRWPVSVKWSLRDPRASKAENNSDGEFDPDLLLRYAIERINLPSGRKLFSWLIKQPIIQRYYVILFWLIKIKFFEGTDENIMKFTNCLTEDRELYLMKLLSHEYRLIVELLAVRSHAEHEKDFVYKYLPFILTNGVFYGFYYIFPGSRHLYTKGFKKTIYMQIIKIMHGFQICPISVKVSWAKLFPEDDHGGGGGGGAQQGGGGKGAGENETEDGEDGGEVFPVKLAIKTSPLSKYRSSRTNSPNARRGGGGGGGLSPSSRGDTTANTSDDGMDGGGGGGTARTGSNDDVSPGNTNTMTMIREPSSMMMVAKAGMLTVDTDTANNVNNMNNNSLTAGKYGNTEDQQQQTVKEGGSPMTKARSYSNIEVSRPSTGGVSKISHASSNKSHMSSTNNNKSSRKSSTSPSSNRSQFQSQQQLLPPLLVSNHNILQQQPMLMHPLSKTYLQPLLEKPSNVRSLITRQNNLERLNAQDLSPQMVLFLTERMSSTAIKDSGKDIDIDKSNSKQQFKRTIPVQWCAAGGTDTHQKRSVSTDLHNDISVKLRQSQSEYLLQTYHFHHEKIKAVRDNQKTLEKILSSGSTNISRLSLDLIRRQRTLRGNKDAKNGGTTEAPQTHIEELDLAAVTALANYDDNEIDNFLAEL